MKQLIKVFNDAQRIKKRKELLQNVVLTPELELVLGAMEEYIATLPEGDNITDWDLFSTHFFTVKYPGLTTNEAEVYKNIFEYLEENPELGDEEKNIFHAILSKQYGEMIADASYSIAYGNSDEELKDTVTDMLDQYEQQLESVSIILNDEEEQESSDIFDSLDDIISKSGYSWKLSELNQSLGPLSDGDFLVLGGRPDSGKTTLLASEVVHVGSQIDGGSILWLTNEERSSRIKLRIIQSALGKCQDDIVMDLMTAKIDFKKVVQADIQVHNIYGWDTRKVGNLIKQKKPKLLVFDQLAKLVCNEPYAHDAERLAKLAAKARSWSADFPVITTCWADGTAEGEKYIEMNQLYGSKTGVQGEADAIVTIGRMHNDPIPDARYIYVPKNKLVGGEPTKRNARWEVRIHPEIARYSSVYTAA